MNELEKMAARIVRPLRASERRKLRMREELLSHLVAVFESERSRVATDDEALAEVQRRWGDREASTRQLQASVPPLERLRHSNILPIDLIGREKQPGESTASFAARFATVTTAMCATIALFVGLGTLVDGRPVDVLLTSGTVLIVCLWLTAFISAACFDLSTLRERTLPSSATHPIAKALAIAVFSASFAAAFLVSLSVALPFVLGKPPALSLFAFMATLPSWSLALVGLALVALQTVAMANERRMFEQDAELE